MSSTRRTERVDHRGVAEGAFGLVRPPGHNEEAGRSGVGLHLGE
ncbi:MAG: hypothetical protein ACRDRK_16135 [Pseudonocardia sp.]